MATRAVAAPTELGMAEAMVLETETTVVASVVATLEEAARVRRLEDTVALLVVEAWDRR